MGGSGAIGARERSPDEKNGRSVHRRRIVEVGESRPPLVLVGAGDARDDYGREVWREAGVEKVALNAAKISTGHVDDEAGVFAGEAAPIVSRVSWICR